MKRYYAFFAIAVGAVQEPLMLNSHGEFYNG